ncbi:hypothetical protein FHR90_001744 [Endobacter medicaginis]|uniref:Acetoacetate decarboxylase n=2 Tax=Endobacter medicaginis TaxID=1181271 RepID=A0A839V2W2_9PROT|nr:acetoacetate decarboxylase [Endobacter medicaginis]MBB3173912.1 hypothetical protein [Endobacter medicaginis]MCX5475967.1 acetoacetate decarboxylase [Endobacter medicaginis]
MLDLQPGFNPSVADMAQTTAMNGETVSVVFGDETVQVPKGGFYDRFHARPDLDAVADEPGVGRLDFFRRIPRQRVASRVGRVWAPNFYYRVRSAQLLMAAPMSRLRAMLPAELSPLAALPGRGLVALSFFSYAVCDNDPYDEVSIAVVIRRPGARGRDGAELLRQLRRRNVFAHVLALPVTTEIARTRGVQAYQLPKWLTPIALGLDGGVHARIANRDGTPDLTLTAPAPHCLDCPSQSQLSRSTMIHRVDGRWHRTEVRSNPLCSAQRLLPRDVTLTRHGGPMSELLDALGASTMLRFDVTRDGQSVLDMPVPLEANASF